MSGAKGHVGRDGDDFTVGKFAAFLISAGVLAAQTTNVDRALLAGECAFEAMAAQFCSSARHAAAPTAFEWRSPAFEILQ
jgi:hypothetical protein